MCHQGQLHPQHWESAWGTAARPPPPPPAWRNPPSSPGSLGMGVTKPRGLGPNPGVLTPIPPTAAQPWEGRGSAASGVTEGR